MPFFPVDDDFAFHAKARAAGNAAVGLWVRAGSYCMKQATDGIVQRHELDGLGKPAEARKLVEVGLWHAHGHGCGRCPQPPRGAWIFHDWTETGPLKTAQQIREHRDAARERQRARRSRQVSQRDTPRESHSTSGVSHASPSPSPSSVVTEVSRLAVVTAHGIDDDGLDQISKITGGDRSHAARVAGQVLAKSNGDVRNPLRYVLRAVNGPERDQYRAAARRTRDTECVTHPGYPAPPHCGAHRADQLAAGGDA